MSKKVSVPACVTCGINCLNCLWSDCCEQYQHDDPCYSQAYITMSENELQAYLKKYDIEIDAECIRQ